MCKGGEQHCIIIPGTKKYFEICVNEVVFGYCPSTIEIDNRDKEDRIKKKKTEDKIVFDNGVQSKVIVSMLYFF